jgi:hypothetical protein
VRSQRAIHRRLLRVGHSYSYSYSSFNYLLEPFQVQFHDGVDVAVVRRQYPHRELVRRLDLGDVQSIVRAGVDGDVDGYVLGQLLAP